MEEEILKGCKIYVWKEAYDILKSKKTYKSAFANIMDNNEITVIVKQNEYNHKDVIKISRGWKIITFDTVLQFELVGFLAKISKALADEKIGILTISSYSTDHILVRKKHLKKALRALTKLGCILE